MILDDIVLQKQKEINKMKKEKKSFLKCLKTNKFSLIAEIKKASPSKGIIAKNFSPQRQLKKYIAGGATAISILTDKKFFQGKKEIITKLRPETKLPILRKEFIIEPLQVYESFFLGADIILLIAAILDLKQLKNLLSIASELNLEAIVEVHSLDDLNKVLNTKAEIIGINNRNLHDFTVDLTTSAKIINELVKKNLKNEYYLIAESGIKTKADINYLKELGVKGVLIGEALMKSEDPVKMIKDFLN